MDKLTKNSIIQKIKQLRESAKFVDKTLEAELNQLLTTLTNGPMNTLSEETVTRLNQIEFLIEQLNIRIQRRQAATKKDESGASSDRGTGEITPFSPMAFIVSLKLSGRPDAKQVAEELERLNILFTELTDSNFRGDSAERIRTHAIEIQEEFWGGKEVNWVVIGACYKILEQEN